MSEYEEILTEWTNHTNGAYCNYNNNILNVTTYGRLYNWYAVEDERGLAPNGWHIPTDDEWKQLEMYFGMSQEEADKTGYRGTDEGGKLKETGTKHWGTPNKGATNETGFTALPGGAWPSNSEGRNGSIGTFGYFWTSSFDDVYKGKWYRDFNSYHLDISRLNTNLPTWAGRQWGLSVRCIKD